MKQEMQKAMEEVKKERINIEKEMQQLKADLQRDKQQMEKEMNEAKKEMTKAKEELTTYKTMLAEMEKEGLIKKDEDYTIAFDKGELRINGKQQPKEVTEKYRKYIKKEGLRIRRNEGDINID